MAGFSTKPTCLSPDTQPSPWASFPSLVPPILPLPLLIKGHLLSFLSASSCVSSSSSLIGEFIEVSDWAVLSAPPLVTCHEKISPFSKNTPSFSEDGPLLSPPLLRCSSLSTSRDKMVQGCLLVDNTFYNVHHAFKRLHLTLDRCL